VLAVREASSRVHLPQRHARFYGINAMKLDYDLNLVKLDPVTGVMPKDEFAALTALPHGEAIKKVRQYDPLFGLKDGEKIRWKVEARADMRGTAYVQAASQEEANKLADKLSDAAFDWDTSDHIEIDCVEPDVRRARRS
jgi:hypothetical protein